MFVTDLDGTLLDANYSYEAAQLALKLLSDLQIPLVLCTSKTRAEVEVYRLWLDNPHPFIVENGGALYIPEGYFPLSINTPIHRDGYAVIEFGSPYQKLVHGLRVASLASGCSVRGFHQMSVEEVSVRCGMTRMAAWLAKQREYDEPFDILSGEAGKLLDAIQRQKKRWTRGGAFYHILGANDKAHCVNLLRYYYEKMFGRMVLVGLGDGINDAGFLKSVDIPLLLESAAINDLKRMVPRGRICRSGGPQGWNAAVLEVIEQYLPLEGENIGMDSDGLGQEQPVSTLNPHYS
jgi:mannosyl-3-phosphoglycerate phosphatase